MSKIEITTEFDIGEIIETYCDNIHNASDTFRKKYKTEVANIISGILFDFDEFTVIDILAKVIKEHSALDDDFIDLLNKKIGTK
jgi:hypothetical protein